MQISVVKNDITSMNVDAIVNAANTSLLGGGGVDGAIHRKAGPTLLAACQAIRAKQGGCATGDAVITHAGNLPSKFVIHTVGPVWQGGQHNEKQLLASCYTQALQLAVANDVRSIAFPNISTGVYHFPKAEAAKIAIDTVHKFIETQPLGNLTDVYFVCFDDANFQLYQQRLAM